MVASASPAVNQAETLVSAEPRGFVGALTTVFRVAGFLVVRFLGDLLADFLTRDLALLRAGFLALFAMSDLRAGSWKVSAIVPLGMQIGPSAASRERLGRLEVTLQS